MLEDNNQIVFKYSSRDGKTNESQNPNGSMNNIAGIVNKKKNILLIYLKNLKYLIILFYD